MFNKEDMIKKRVAIINGPNMNLLGVREVEHYGKETLKVIEDNLMRLASELSVELIMYQSNHEGNIVDFIQENRMVLDGIVINPAAFTKSSYSILEALLAVNIPFIEVHLSNIFARETWHQESIFSSKAVGTIVGLRVFVYELGLRGILNYLKTNKRLKEEVL